MGRRVSSADIDWDLIKASTRRVESSMGFKFPVPADYRDGGAGFKQWVEDFVCVDIYPPGSPIPTWTPISDLPMGYRTLWLHQARLCLDMLKMEDGLFKYSLLVLCWMRGEGKSLLVCLIQMWKFFNWPKQTIVLGANSKDQTKFVHFDIIRNIILNSPKLLRIVGKRNIQEKEIRLRDGNGNVASFIRPISSFSGIVSNITGYTFSEMFDMRNPKFFTQLDGSIRNIPNALGTIDSTVSTKDHILYKLYQQGREGEITNMFFSHRSSSKAQAKDYWNPNMTQEQLNNYKRKFHSVDFDRYFKNTWDSGTKKSLTDALIAAGRFFGTKDSFWNPKGVLKACAVLDKLDHTKVDIDQWDLYKQSESKQRLVRKLNSKMAEISEGLNPVSNSYRIDGLGSGADVNTLQYLGDKLDTDWVVLAGIDRSDPGAVEAKARTCIPIIAKGLPGSRSHYIDLDGREPNYCYILLRLYAAIRTPSSVIKDFLLEADLDFEGLDMICAERWAMGDMHEWALENNLPSELVTNTYPTQLSMFNLMYTAWESGNFKYPDVKITGYKGDNVLEEEASAFVHDVARRYFGSLEKKEYGGVQDDVIFSIALAMYGGRMMGVDVFRNRKGWSYFGTMIMPGSQHSLSIPTAAYR